MLLFDSMAFVDDDGRVYMYYSGRHADGIWGVELDRKDLTHFAGPAKKLWTFDPSHVWERYGDNNEGTSLSWLEAPWMTKHNGTYYLQYSAPGTEWKTYAVGVYTSRSPLGPFRYAPVNPILVHKNGLINGTGHHSIVQGPDGNLWAIYTILYRNWNVFDRRIGLDPVGFDAMGNMFIAGPSESPQWGPGNAAKPSLDNASGSLAVSTNRYSWAVSSARPDAILNTRSTTMSVHGGSPPTRTTNPGSCWTSAAAIPPTPTRSSSLTPVASYSTSLHPSASSSASTDIPVGSPAAAEASRRPRIITVSRLHWTTRPGPPPSTTPPTRACKMSSSPKSRPSVAGTCA